MKFQYVNLFGVLVLGCLCVIQWRVNRDLNLETNRLEQLRLDQQVQLEERDRSIQGYLADLDQFRHQFTEVRDRLKETEASLAAARRELELLSQERDQLRTSVTNWAAAVDARDEQHHAVVEELNHRTQQFNELAERYRKMAAP